MSRSVSWKEELSEIELNLHWRNSSREIPRCIFFVKLKKMFFFPFFSLLFSFKIPYYSPITQLSFSYIFMIFLIRENSFFLFLVFLSYFLLKSSNTPLLFLNLHFHFTLTLQNKKEREALFLNWTSYIFLNFFMFLFLFLNIVFQRV